MNGSPGRSCSRRSAQISTGRGIAEVEVLTGHQNLPFYYEGSAKKFASWSAPWILVSQKYFHRIPAEIGPVVRSTAFGIRRSSGFIVGLKAWSSDPGGVGIR